MYILNNGVKIPKIGFGTWKITDKEQCKNAVITALELGYRHIDTATVYTNEDAVGSGINEFIKSTGIPREDIFVTTKLWNTEQGYESALKAFDQSLKSLQLDYIDMYMIHWPQPKDLNKTWESWKALETIYKSGKVRAISVCNMKEHHLQYIIDNFEIIPAVNQVELHPNLQQPNLREFCKKHNILVEPWSPLMQGQLDNEDLIRIASKYDKTVAQVVLRWHIQNGMLPLPKSVTPSRIKENLDINFNLSDEDMNYINSLNRDERIGPDPDDIDF